MKPMIMNVGFEKNLVRPEGGSIRYLVVDLEAPSVKARREKRPDLNLALVIDRSGSMGGGRLEAAKTAAEGVVEGLREGDRLSLVAFDHESVVLLKGCRMTVEGKVRAQEAIHALDTGGMTNLGQGWFDGAKCVANDQARGAGAMNRVVVLSDGHANQGMIQPSELASHARKLAEAGVLTSAVGIGDDYSPHQLQALADFGGGRLHDAGTPGEIIEIVLMELGEMVETVAERVMVRLECPTSVKPLLLGTYASETTDRGLVCDVGALTSGARRRVVFQIEVPEGKVGDEIAFSTEVSWVVPGSAGDRQGAFRTAHLTYAPARERAEQTVDKERAQSAANTWKAALTQEAVDRNQAGDCAGAVRAYEHAEARFALLCEDASDGAQLKAEYDVLCSTNSRPMSRRAGKDLRDMAMAEERIRSVSRAATRRRARSSELQAFNAEKAKRRVKKDA